MAGGWGLGLQAIKEVEQVEEEGVGGAQRGQPNPAAVKEALLAAEAEGPADAGEEPAELAAAHVGMWVGPIQPGQAAAGAGGSPMPALAAGAPAAMPAAAPARGAAASPDAAAAPARGAAAPPDAAAAPAGAAAASALAEAAAAQQQAEEPRGPGKAAVLEAEVRSIFIAVALVGIGAGWFGCWVGWVLSLLAGPNGCICLSVELSVGA